MGVVERKSELFDRVLRLRRAEREHPANQDIVSVRADLEREIGSVISRSLAARLLGVRHSSLQRWIDSNDLPLVMAEDGRVGVPVAAVAELYERVHAETDRGSPRRHVLESAFAAGRQRAQELDPHTLVERADGSGVADVDPHARAALRSLAYHRAVAQRLGRPTVAAALHQIWQWRREGRIDDRYAEAWERLLHSSLAEIKRKIGEDSAEAADLRQNSPFAGMLSEAERRRIIEAIR
jgi:hypothetical protein